jgi:hypothetical protein
MQQRPVRLTIPLAIKIAHFPASLLTILPRERLPRRGLPQPNGDCETILNWRLCLPPGIVAGFDLAQQSPFELGLKFTND